jgi:sugar phosphate isomerase/epimerase
MKNIIGVSSTTYVGHSFEEVLESVSEIGFKFVELVSAPGINEHIDPRPEVMKPEDIKRIKALCDDYKVEIYALGGHCRLLKDGGTDNFKKVLDLAYDLDVKYVSTDTGEIESEDDKKRFYREILEIADHAALKNISICVEMHGNWFNNGKKAVEILNKINRQNVKINYDTGNVIYFNNTRPEEDIKYAVPYLGIIHLKDSSGKFKDWDFPAIGEGNIEFEKIFNALENYDGPISLEIEFNGDVQPLKKINTALVDSMNFLKKYGYQKFS